MNGYNLTRAWYDFKFDNVGKVKAVHSDMYFYIIDLWNRLGQKDCFGLPTSVTMEALGINSYNTFKKVLDDLIEFKFIVLISESKNQHSSKVIALVTALKENYKATDKALDKAHAKATDKALDKASNKALDSITKQLNNRTNEQLNNEIKEIKEIKEKEVFDLEIENKKPTSKKSNVEVLSKYHDELETVLQIFNEVLKTDYRSYKSFSANYEYWRKTYTPEEIEQAIRNIPSDSFWNDRIDPTVFFRRKYQNGENADYIGKFRNQREKTNIEKHSDNVEKASVGYIQKLMTQQA